MKFNLNLRYPNHQRDSGDLQPIRGIITVITLHRQDETIQIVDSVVLVEEYREEEEAEDRNLEFLPTMETLLILATMSRTPIWEILQNFMQKSCREWENARPEKVILTRERNLREGIGAQEEIGEGLGFLRVRVVMMASIQTILTPVRIRINWKSFLLQVIEVCI